MSSTRKLFFTILGLSFFWQFFRFSNLAALFSMLQQQQRFAETFFTLTMVLAALFGIVFALRETPGKATGNPLAISIASCMPALLFSLLYPLPHVADATTPLCAAFMALLYAIALVSLLLSWARWLFSQFWDSLSEFIICLACSLALSFFLSSLFVEAQIGELPMALIMGPACGWLYYAAAKTQPAVKSVVADVDDGLPEVFERPREFVLLAGSTMVFFALALSVSGSINSSELNPSAEPNVTLKHLATIAELLVFMGLSLLTYNWRKLLYEGWLLFGIAFLSGLVLVGIRELGFENAGVVLVTAGRGCFELLLFAFALLGAKRYGIVRSITVIFLVPETLASVASRSVLPAIFNQLQWTFSDYAWLLSMVLSIILVVGIILHLLLQLFSQIDNDAKRIDVTDAETKPSLDLAWDELGLTPAERNIAQYFIKGYTSERVAERECLSVNTVRTHIKNIYRKAQVHSRQELIDLVENTSKQGPR